MSEVRIERDSMGEMEVPADAYFAAQTQRAFLNFPISGIRFPRPFIRALGLIKKAAAETNAELGLVPPEIANAIGEAATEVIEGRLDNHFVLDIFQTGSGTSTNMNTNEVIANRAIEIMGGEMGSKSVHPNDHVNYGQSSNDVIPTAIHVSALEQIERHLLPALTELEAALRAKSRQFDDVVKIGRTHLQDAVPVRLGQEFGGHATMVAHGIRRLENCRQSLAELAIGGTAVGTGLNCHAAFPPRVVEKIGEWTDISFCEAGDRFEALATRDAAVEASGMLKTVAVSLMKIANDIRWLGSGPRCGLGEIVLPATQPGSSIMPAKVNPVIAEAVAMVSAQVMGNDVTINIAGQSGNFELNVMKPVVAHNLLESINLLGNAATVFVARCISGLEADREHCEEMVEKSLAMVTSLAPLIGYDEAARIAKEAFQSGRTVRELCVERGVLPEEELARALDPRRMTEGG